MYAIIETGGKQYRIKQGDVIDVELLNEDKEVTFSSVLLLNDGSAVKVGAPYVEKAQVKGEILGQVKGLKVIAYKYRRRKSSSKKVGHRQKYLRVKITDIVKGDK